MKLKSALIPLHAQYSRNHYHPLELSDSVDVISTFFYLLSKVSDSSATIPLEKAKNSYFYFISAHGVR